MLARIAIFILLFTAFISLCNMSVLTLLRKNRLFNKRSADRASTGKNAVLRRLRFPNRAENSGKRGFNFLPAGYRLKLASILRYSAFDAGVDGLLRIKVLFGLLGFTGGLLIKNPFLAVVMLAGFFWLPDAYFRITSVRYAKEADDAAEAAMGLVTNSYLQNEDIKSSILENLPRIDPPLREVFREFTAETGFIDASVKNAILRMKQKTDNAYFGDWCDILVQCQDDRELKFSLPSIVTKLNSVKKIQVELDTAMYDIYKEFFYIVAIVVLNMPLMFLINAEWADILFGSPIGKLTVAVCALVIFTASAYVVSVNRSLVRMNE